jgi:pimeloyl-ACP methyl ester carboxylesterase
MSSFDLPAHLQATARTIVIDGIRLHCYDAGAPSADPPIILIHGLGDEADTWRHLILPLAESRRVVALDLPGFGRSDHPYVAYTLAFYAKIIAKLIGALEVKRAILVGSSMGAAIAQRLALVQPELVEQLILVAGGVPIARSLPTGPIWLFLIPGVGELIYTSLRRSSDGGYSTLEPYYYRLAELPEADRTFLAKRVRDRVSSNGQRRAFLSALRWGAIERAFRTDQLRRLVIQQSTPTHLIWGEHDQIVPVALAHALAALLPNGRVTIMPACGHLPQQERPEELLELIKATVTTY